MGRERASKNSIYRLLYLSLCATRLCGFGKSFSPSFIASETFFFSVFFRTSFLLSFQPQTLFFLIFRQTRYAKRTQAKTYRTRMPFIRTSMPFDRTRMPFNRNSMPFDRFDRTFMPFDRTPPWIVNTVDSR